MDDGAMVVTELYLRRRAAGLTHQEVIGELADYYQDGGGVDLMTLVRWEHRWRQPRGRNVQALRSYHQVDSIAELGLGHTPQAVERWTWATKPEIEAEVARRRAAQALAAKETQVDRRTAVQTALTGVGAALLPVGPLTAAAQLLGGRPSIGLGDVRAAEDVATHLAVEYLAEPGKETVRAALAHARTLTDRFTHARMTDAVRTRLAAVASDAASLVGAAKQGAGLMTEARAWFGHAIALARRAKDPRLETLAVAYKAWTPLHLLGSGNRIDSVEALQAAALDRSLLAAGRAYVYSLLARELATARNDLDSGRALERALEAAALVSREEPGWGYWSQHAGLSGWDEVRPTVYTGLRPLYLGRYQEAMALFESALDGTSVPGRRARLHANLTETSAGLDKCDQACATAVAALDEAEPHGLGSIRDDIRALRAGFPSSWESNAALAELDERLGVA